MYWRVVCRSGAGSEGLSEHNVGKKMDEPQGSTSNEDERRLELTIRRKFNEVL
jgi:hypothetical protein